MKLLNKERSNVLRLTLVAILLQVFSDSVLSVEEELCNSNNTIRIGSGREDGSYFRFTKEWMTYNNKIEGNPCISNVVSDGSLTNLDDIENGKIDFAIIQNDIGNHAFYGLRGKRENISFKGLSPLFKEYVQIVTLTDKDQVIKTISDLAGKQIAVGTKGAGGYWNAIDLLTAAKMREGFDFSFVLSDINDPLHPLEMMLKGKADVAIYTSANPHKLLVDNPEGRLSVLSVPIAAVKELSISMRRPYYVHGFLDIKRNNETIKVETISVISYLVVADKVGDKTVTSLRDSISEFKEYARENLVGGAVTYVNNHTTDYPFEMHPLAIGERIKLISTLPFISQKKWLEIIIFITSLLLLSGWLAAQKVAKYDSLGIIKKNSFYSNTWSGFLSLSSYAIGFVLWLFWVQAVALIIMWRESLYAENHDIESPLAGFGALDRGLWLIKTAFTNLPGEIPLSPLSAMLIPLVPLFGIAVLMRVVYKILKGQQQHIIDRMKGEYVDKKLHSHVLICGWNSSAPGIINSLTSEYAPKTKKVVVVAEMEGELPLAQYNLHPKAVFYIRGDSANLEILRKARAEYATEALVLAGDKKVGTKNVGSILTVLALRKLTQSNKSKMKDKLFIGVELRYLENRNAFLRAGADEVVDTKNLTDHVVALSLLSQKTSDFIIDFLTYDKFLKLYSDKVEDVPEKVKSSCRVIASEEQVTGVTYDYGKFEHQLMRNGIQLFGLTKNIGESDYDNPILKDRGNQNSIVVHDKDRLVYFSNRKTDIKDVQDMEPSSSTRSRLSLPEIEELNHYNNNAIVGTEERIKDIKNIINQKSSSIITITYNELTKIITEKEQTDCQKLIFDKFKDVNSVLLLSNNKEKSSTNLTNGQNNYSDTASLLIIEELKKLEGDKDLKMNIVAEIEEHSSREIFRETGADQVIPRRILLERVLAKMVFNHGRMYEFLMELVTSSDGKYLRSYKVKEGDFFVGHEIKELMLGNAEGYKICGWFPVSCETELEKDTMGYGYHFITAFNNKHVNGIISNSTKVEVGDTLMILYIDNVHKSESN